MLDKEKILIIGSASQILGIKIANKLGIECIDTEFKTFPDGENYLRINVEDETILEGNRRGYWSVVSGDNDETSGGKS